MNCIEMKLANNRAILESHKILIDEYELLDLLAEKVW